MTQLELNIKALKDMGVRVKHLASIENSPQLITLKDFDIHKGIVSFYFSNFNSKDSDNDIIKAGAFSKTIQENRKRIKHLKNHDLTQAPGAIIDLGEDTIGAFAVSQLAKSTLGRDTLIEYETGIITEHSMGFQVIKESFDQFSGANIISELKLWEVSSLTAWGANELTPIIGVKEKIEAIETAVNTTNISDERAKELIEIAELLKLKLINN